MQGNKKFTIFLCVSLSAIILFNIFILVKMNSDKKELYSFLDQKLSPESTFSKDLQAKISESISASLKDYMVENNNNQNKKIAIMMEEAERTYQVYSKEYIKMLTQNSMANKEILYPKGSLSEHTNEKMEAFLENEDLKNYKKALNHGIITADGEIRNSSTILSERLKELFPDKSDVEINEMILNKSK